jgi:hypothetical protein
MKAFSKLLVVTFVVAFALSRAALAAPPKQPATPAPQPHSGAVTTAEVPSVLSGKVVETMNAGGYTYVCLEKKGKKTWVAVPEMTVKVGQEVSFPEGQEMPNFTSKTLNRTFESIIFTSGPVEQKAAAKGAAAPGGTGGGSKAASSSLAKDIKIEKAACPGAYTVGEIFAKRASLNKKTAVIKAKVVKVSAGIMGKNWIHLQDGSGDPEKGSHDLVVTSQDLPSVGDVVTVKGTVYKDKDFGAGYKYTVIMEEAKVQR